MIPLSIHDSFQFSCSEKVPCFNECCRDLNQFLTPYDILRLTRRLKIDSGVFLQKYTTAHIGPGTGLPVITLKMIPESDYKCPFVTPAGCSVYEDRPASCRIYPLARALSRSRETGELREHFMLIKEPHCKGFEQQHTQTVQEWLANQGLPPYNKMNDELMEIISLKNRIIAGPLDLRSAELFHLACYDLDAFRKKVPDGLPDHFMASPAVTDAIMYDDIALMRLGQAWIKNMLFGQEMPPGEAIIEA